MSQGFWKELRKPIMALAPMYGVTDAAFRRIISELGKPDVFFTEFVSADGICSEEGRKKIACHLIFSQSERSIVAQLFGANPKTMERAAAEMAKLGFDGVDINMGCPDKAVEKGGGGAALIKNPKLARELIRAAKRGAARLPVSVKTRIGYLKNELSTWLPEILAEDPAAVVIHARTREEMSKVPARWECVAEAVEIRNRLGSEAIIIGNGDLKNIADAKEKVRASGADGAMFGRAVFGNPWLFLSSQEHQNNSPTVAQRLEVLCEHAALFERCLGGAENFSVMRKHFKSYVFGWNGAKELRMKLMEAKNAEETRVIIREWQERLKIGLF